MGWVLFNRDTNMYWTGNGWSEKESDSDVFYYKFFAEIGAEELSSEFGYVVVRPKETSK